MKNRFQISALSQIFLLVVSVVAFSYAVGSEVGGVSGATVHFGSTNDPKGVNAIWSSTDTPGIWKCDSGCKGIIQGETANLCKFYGSGYISSAGICSGEIFQELNPLIPVGTGAAPPVASAAPVATSMPKVVAFDPYPNTRNCIDWGHTPSYCQANAGRDGTYFPPPEPWEKTTIQLEKENWELGEITLTEDGSYVTTGVKDGAKELFTVDKDGKITSQINIAGKTAEEAVQDELRNRGGARDTYFGTGQPGQEIVNECNPTIADCSDFTSPIEAEVKLASDFCIEKPTDSRCAGFEPEIADEDTIADLASDFCIEKPTDSRCAGFESATSAKPAELITGKQSSFLGHIGTGLAHALLFKAAASLLGPVLGATGSQTEKIGNAGALGIFVANVAEGALKEAAENSYSWAPTTAEGAATAGNWIGVGVAAYYFLHEYKEEGTVTTSFSCLPWQPPLSGKNCEKCNNGFLPCSEYQCKSLGQACELVNKGSSEEACVWVNKNDVSPPTIEALESALLNENYEYAPDGAILPPDRGVRVQYLASTQGDNCVPAFTPLRIGVELNEPAKCKIDTLRKNDFKTMEIEMSSGLLQYNHTFSLSLPGTANAETGGIDVANDGEYSLFVRCEDANENANIGTFVFNYCVDKGPDTTPPLIVATSVPNNMPIAYNQSVLDLQVYINEPAECKWSHNNRDYATMEEQMDCQTTIGDTNAQGLYTCDANLTGLKDRFTNTFYFRCQDKSTTPNENAESLVYNVVGTQALVITSASPNDTTIKDSTSAVKVSFNVRTTAGYKDGESSCEYSDTGLTDDYVKFFETDKSEHKQDLYLPEGTYDYFIRCRDLGGNTDIEKITFTTESDNEAPIVVRAYHEEQYLKIQTIEEAKCVYDVVDCTYDVKDGTPMTSVDGINHFTNWDIKSNVYVKCEDTYGNQPLPNACSIIVKSTTF